MNQSAPAGSVLVQLAAASAQARLTLDALPSTVNGKVFLPYPQALTGFDTPPAAVLQDLVTRDWIERDPLKPMLKFRAHEGVSGVWLTREVSRHLLALGLDPPVAGHPEPTLPAESTQSVAVATTVPTACASAPATAATDYACVVRQRLLARDPALGPITERSNALSVSLRGPVLDGAKRAGLSETALLRALEKLPGMYPVAKGMITLGL
ncbi:hypothetical protein [uncultured Thiocystis sp.]|uniref:hypothetical protein n=1 Tax=uncultured Thiocystis sp. TaxID=1202134 RepID=UPI0025FA83CC|nr:hypothetical protein [uncultured Thiocystis sp.]